MKPEIIKNIKSVVFSNDYTNGENFKKENITLRGTQEYDGNEYFNFYIKSDYYSYNFVEIGIKKKRIEHTNCNCYQFYETDSCKHVAACLIHFQDIIFRKSYETEEEKALRIMGLVKEKLAPKTSQKKEEVFIIPYLTLQYNDYYNKSYTILKARIGINKKYNLTTKAYYFIQAYNENKPYKFGKDFTYDPNIHYLSDTSKRLLSFIKNIDPYSRGITLKTEHLDELLEICKNEIYIENIKKTVTVKNEFPLSSNISKKKDKYILTIVDDEDITFLTNDTKYIYTNNNIYRLNNAQQVFFESCIQEEIKELTFNESEFKTFEESLIPVIKEKITTDETTKDILIMNKPKVKLYFDILEDSVTSVPKYDFNGEEISFFEKNTNIIKDIDFENEIEELLYKYDFEKGTKSFVLTDLDSICNLIETGFNEIAEMHEVYTSEKLKNTNIIKNNTISSTFSIGKDNILTYSFDLGEINADELEAIMKSMNNNKKYYRLKSGDIISLEEETIQELHDLKEDLELENSIGTIPKYRALYLDYLKENKYGIIKTDSLFQNFINQFNEYKSVELKLTKKERDILRDYQEEGVKWLYTIKKCGFGGILADEMGLGKSIQSIYFIKKLIEENNTSKFLIVCPTSLVYNWENEFNKFAPDLDYKVFAGLKQNRLKSLEEYNGNIYITTYGLLREDLEYYEKMNFEVFIIDEAQNIKNPKIGITKAVKKIDATTKLALTGTPIENSVVELWSIFDFIMPGLLSNLMTFSRKYNIKDVTNDKTIDTLKKQVRPFILRRKKKDVIKDLPEKIENNIFIDLNEEQKKVYATEVTYVQGEMKKIIDNGNFKKESFLILKLLTRLRQICIEPSIIHKNYKGGSSKIENLVKIIKEVSDNGHKILLFTSFKTALNIVKHELDKEDISNYTIAGDVKAKQRQQLVDAFNKDNTKVFLIMLKSGGTGLNLTSADVVIHLDLWWNPQVENQATDRAHRIGQTNTVEVIKLICKGTIEERILELQDKKKILSERILETDMNDASYIKELNEEDIKNLITYNNE